VQHAMLKDELIPLIRNQFARAEANANGRRRVFFENAAGSLVLQSPADAEARARVDCSASVDGPSWESKRNEAVIRSGREAVSDFLNAPGSTCTVMRQ
jgi:selenocysteine lyase/cysteine desulfurase